MSVQAIGWVLDHSTTRGADRLVLIALANYASSDGWDCYPSIATIARCAGIARERTVQECLARLAENGHIERVINGAPDSRIRGDRRPNHYRILRTDGVSESDIPQAERGVASRPNGVSFRAERGVASRPNGVSESATQTVIEPSKDPLVDPLGASAPPDSDVFKAPRKRSITTADIERLQEEYPGVDVKLAAEDYLNWKGSAGHNDKVRGLRNQLRSEMTRRKFARGGTPQSEVDRLTEERLALMRERQGK